MTGQSGNENHPQHRHPYRFYWLTGGLAVLLAAIIGASLAHSSSGPADNPGSSKAQNSVPVPTVTANQPNPPSFSSAPGSNGSISLAPTIRHKGPLELNETVGADLDSTANNWDVATNLTSGDIYISTGWVVSPSGQIAALGNLSPDYQDCSSTTNYIPEGIPLSSLNSGANFCIQTD